MANPLIALQSRAPDIGQAFSNALMNIQAIDNIRQSRAEAPLRKQQFEMQNQALALGNQQTRNTMDRAQQEALLKDQVIMAAQINAAPDNLSKMRTADALRQRLIDSGAPPEAMQGLEEVLDMGRRGDFAGMQEMLSGVINMGQQMGLLTADPATQNRASTKSYAPVTLQNPKTGEKRYMAPTFNPATNQAELRPFDVPKGFEVVAETPEEKRIRDRLSALEEAQGKSDIEVSKLTGKARENRIINIIDTGIAAAETVPTYERMIELVDTVSTGGIQAGIQKAGQLFGWQSADMGELDALFKEAVLANIRKMGSNPTEGERQFLLDASGSITQSPKVLKRILTRRLNSAKKDQEKALKYARQREDFEAIELLGGSIGGGVPTVNTQEEYDALPSGSLFIEDGKQYRKP